MATRNAVAKKASNSIVSIQEQLKAQAAEAGTRTAPSSGNSIRITQDKHFVLPDGTKTNEAIELVVLDYITEHRFYEGSFDPKNISPPACFALGQNPLKMVPSENSPVKQSDDCQACPMNAFGSSGDGKACKNGRVLAVMQVDADESAPMWRLGVSPTAIKNFDGFVRSAYAKHELPPIGVVVRVSFDPSVTYARLVFDEVGLNPNLETHFARQAEATKMLAIEPDVSTYVPKTRPQGRVAAKGVVRR